MDQQAADVSSKPILKRKAPGTQTLHRCEICSLDFTSSIPLEMHLRGGKHMKKIKALDTLKALQSQGHAKPGDTVTNAFRCDACGVTLNGALQLQTHFEGSKHKNKVKDLLPGSGSAMDVEQNGGAQPKVVTTLPENANNTQPKSPKIARLSCDTCNIIVNSQAQLLQHLSSKKHKAKAEGKPLPGKKKSEDIKGEDLIDNDCLGSEVPKSVHGIAPLSINFVHKGTLN